jgi:hypothetical protein
MRKTNLRSVLLALYPNAVGLGYAVFERELRATDWGIKAARKRKHHTTVQNAAELLRHFSPTHLILPARTLVMKGSERLHQTSLDIARLSHEYGSRVHRYSRADIRSCFAKHGAESKDAIVAVIAKLLPEFQQHVPPRRRIWMSEDYRMGLFDAVALAMTHCSRVR